MHHAIASWHSTLCPVISWKGSCQSITNTSALSISVTMLSWTPNIFLTMQSTTLTDHHTNQTTSVTMQSTSVTILMETPSAGVYQSRELFTGV